jgi:uncharacterized membrane protein YccC
MLSWSEMGRIRKTLVVLGLVIIAAALFPQVMEVVLPCAIGVAVVVVVGRVLYRRKWR